MPETILVKRQPLPPIEVAAVQNRQRPEKTLSATSGETGADAHAAFAVHWMHNPLGVHDPKKPALVQAKERDTNASGVSEYMEYLAHRDDVEEVMMLCRSRDFIERQGDLS